MMVFTFDCRAEISELFEEIETYLFILPQYYIQPNNLAGKSRDF